MSASQHYRLRTRTLLLAVIAVIVSLVAGVVVVSAVDPFPGLPNDGRINVVHHFGGDALYCVSSSGVPTDDFDQTAAMRLLNSGGVQLWSVPIADIQSAIADAQAAPGTAALVFTGSGSYGPASLYVTLDPDSDLTFTFVAYDEWGKTNAMTFEGCGPVGPIPGGAVSAGHVCDGLEGEAYFDCVSSFCLAAIGCEAGDDDSQSPEMLACTPEDYYDCLEDFGIEPA